MKFFLEMGSPVGPLTLCEEDGFLCEIRFAALEGKSTETPLLTKAREQLERYFRGELRVFELPLKPRGTPFRLQCWEALLQIPYGETRTYAQQAALIGKPKACRAVGGANHWNPIPIVIPCHRVVGADGSLTGYGGGTDIKEALLKLEEAHS